MRQRRSTPSTLFGYVTRRFGKAHPAPSTPLDAVEHLLQAGAPGEALQLADEVLLERLAPLLRPMLEGGVDLVRNVPYKHVGHAYIMLALSEILKFGAAKFEAV